MYAKILRMIAELRLPSVASSGQRAASAARSTQLTGDVRHDGAPDWSSPRDRRSRRLERVGAHWQRDLRKSQIPAIVPSSEAASGEYRFKHYDRA